MFRREFIATLLSLLGGSGAVQSLLGAIEDATDEHSTDGLPTDGLHTDGGELAALETDGDSGTDDSGSPTDSTGPGTRTAVVDRIEDDVAVVVFDDGSGTESVPAAVLPEAAREAGVVITVPEGDALSLATVDHAATAERRQAAQEQFDELATDPPESDDPGNGTAAP